MTHSHFLNSLVPIPSGVLEGEMGGTSQQSLPAGLLAVCLWVILRTRTALPWCGSSDAQAALGITAVGICMTGLGHLASHGVGDSLCTKNHLC